MIEDDVILGMVTNATSVGGFKALDDDIVKMDDGLNELILVKAPKVLADYNALVGSLIAGISGQTISIFFSVTP